MSNITQLVLVRNQLNQHESKSVWPELALNLLRFIRQKTSYHKVSKLEKVNNLPFFLLFFLPTTQPTVFLNMSDQFGCCTGGKWHFPSLEALNPQNLCTEDWTSQKTWCQLKVTKSRGLCALDKHTCAHIKNMCVFIYICVCVIYIKTTWSVH